MEVQMEGGEEEILAVREQLRQVQGKVEHLRRIGLEQSRSLAVSVPNLETAVELSLKVASVFGGLELKRNNKASEDVPKKSDSVHTVSGGDHREPLAGPRSAGHGPSFSNGSVEQRGILGAPYKGNVDVEMGGPRDSWGGGDGSEWGADSWGWDGGRPLNALAVVKAMVAGCLLSHTTALPIDSVNIHHRMLAKEVSPFEIDALHEVGGGGEAGGITAVDYALRAMTEAGGLQIEEIEDYRYGGLHVLVLNFDRGRLMKELPGGPPLMGGEHHHRGVMEPNGGPHGLPTRPDMWDHHPGGPPPFPGTGGVPPLMGPRSGPRGMGMLGMPGGGPGFGAPFPRPPHGPGLHGGMGGKGRGPADEEDIDALLHKKSFKEQQQSKTAEELLELLHRPTAKETANAAKFKTKGGSALKEYCAALTKEDCRHQRNYFIACKKMHFRRIIAPHTDSNLGDCSFLDTCRHMKTCKYVHYELDPIPDVPDLMMTTGIVPNQRPGSRPQRAEYCSDAELGEPQWVQCDIRNFKMDVLGQFGVIMADPPWDIHMELPYGTMADDEMRNLNVPALQTDGLIFLWVTGRAMELGRECLELWGYKRVEEIIWVKTNQLQRIIRTGRTGHWLNHSKEHCLVGIKGHPDVNRNIDTDVIVAEVRETSRKPDEMYPLLERISPRTRKLELFARMHNTHAGWMSLGNQLNGVRLVDEGLRARYKAAYPDQVIQPPDPPTRTGGQDNKASVVHGNDSASTQTKSSPASTHKIEIVTAASTVTHSTFHCSRFNISGTKREHLGKLWMWDASMMVKKTIGVAMERSQKHRRVSAKTLVSFCWQPLLGLGCCTLYPTIKALSGRLVQCLFSTI